MKRYCSIDDFEKIYDVQEKKYHKKYYKTTDRVLNLAEFWDSLIGITKLTSPEVAERIRFLLIKRGICDYRGGSLIG